MNENSFASWLRAQRRELGYTQEELAELIGYSAASIRKLEGGQRRPSGEIARLLAPHFGIPEREVETFVREGRAGRGWPNQAASIAPPQQAPQPAHAPVLAGEDSAAPACNIPARLAPVVGREAPVAALHERLLTPAARLVTLVGPPGIGKTTLALEAALTFAVAGSPFGGGVYLVNLAPLSDPALLVDAIAQGLSLKETGEQSPEEMLTAFLRERRALLVLDNFEQVVDAAPVVAGLLGQCPGVKMLVTSREALRVRGEQVYPVPPLDVPNLVTAAAKGRWYDHDAVTVESVAGWSAVRLFVERATAANPQFELTGANAATVAEICAQLEGLPLAIELVAARTRLLRLGEIAARLERKLPLLVGGPRDVPSRQQTLRAAIDWSYNLLVPAEQRLLMRLSVFAGGCDYGAVEAVCNATGDLGIDVLDGLDSLLGKSLLRQEGTPAEQRFAMLDTIHEYAAEKLEEGGEAKQTRRHHAEYFLAMAEVAETHIYTGEQKVWLERLERDHDNLRAAIAWSLSENGDGGDTAMCLGSRLWRFWEVYGHLSEGRRLLQWTLEETLGAPAALRAGVAYGLSRMCWLMGDLQSALFNAEASLGVWRGAGDKEGVARGLHNLAIIAGGLGQHERAGAAYEESLSLWKELRNRAAAARVLSSMAIVARGRGEYARALAMFEEALGLQRALGNDRSVAAVLAGMGLTALVQGDYARAGELLRESLEIRHDLGYKVGVIECLSGLGGVAGGLDNYERGARLLGASDALCEATGYTIEPEDRIAHDEALARVRSGLGDACFQASWLEGRAMTPDEAVALALAPD